MDLLNHFVLHLNSSFAKDSAGMGSSDNNGNRDIYYDTRQFK